jgi:hypothetical protein
MHDSIDTGVKSGRKSPDRRSRVNCRSRVLAVIPVICRRTYSSHIEVEGPVWGSCVSQFESRQLCFVILYMLYPWARTTQSFADGRKSTQLSSHIGPRESPEI